MSDLELAPLPKPRPAIDAGAPSAASNGRTDAAPVPPLVPDNKPEAAPLPN